MATFHRQHKIFQTTFQESFKSIGFCVSKHLSASSMIFIITIMIVFVVSGLADCNPISQETAYPNIQRAIITTSSISNKNREYAHILQKRSQQQQSELLTSSSSNIVSRRANSTSSTTNKPPISVLTGNRSDKTLVETRQLVPQTRQLLPESSGNSRRRPKNKQQKVGIEINDFFREQADNYPEDEIRLILKQTSNELKELFNVFNTPLDPNVNLTERIASRHHNGDEDANNGEFKEESVCRSVTRNIYPREANKADNSLVYVPNNQEFMQVIQAEICQHPNQECNFLQDNLPYGMTSVCQQKYAYKKLLYLDPLEKRMATDLFRYPSCCSCYVRHSSIDLRSSIAANGTSNKLLPQATNSKEADSISDRLPAATNKNLAVSGESLNSSSDIATLGHVNIFENDSNNKRQAKALDSNTDPNKRITSGGQPMKRVTSTESSGAILIEDDLPQPNQKATAFQTNTPDRVAKLTSSFPQTVILQEDKVYKPGS